MSLHWVNDDNAGMLTDLYQLTMLQSYFEHHMNDIAVFDLFVRRLPPSRNYLIACGLEDVLHYLETFSFSSDHLAYLRSVKRFSEAFLQSLVSFRFTGDVYAVREGTAVFANEPLIEVIAPLPEAQIVETFILNQVHLQSLLASKASRVVKQAGGRLVVDYGLRRIHGADAGLKGARAFYIAGVDATSNVLAGEIYGIPVSGTMAHSFVQAHDSEYEAFRHFIETFPDGTLLPTVTMGLGVGTVNSGTCALLSNAFTTAQGGSAPQLSGTISANGTYCVQVSDVSTQVGPVNYSLLVSHP